MTTATGATKTGNLYQDLKEINDFAERRSARTRVFSPVVRSSTHDLNRPKSSHALRKTRPASALGAQLAGARARARAQSAAHRPNTSSSNIQKHLALRGMPAGNTKAMFPVRRPLSSIYESFKKLPPNEIFKAFMDQSDVIHKDLLLQEHQESVAMSK